MIKESKALSAVSKVAENTKPSRLLPGITDGCCTWLLPVRFTDAFGLTCMGGLVASLEQTDARTCAIDMTHVEWSDPLPLLFLAGSLMRSPLPRANITVDLGSDNGRSGRKGFLKFFARQGFMRALSDHCTFVFNNMPVSDWTVLAKYFSSLPCENIYRNADCIHAKVVDVSAFRSDKDAQHRFVELLIREAHKRAINTAFGANLFARDRLFQKIRKLISELTQNVAEHAYDSGCPLVGVYARIREPKPRTAPYADDWQEHYLASVKETPAQGKFEPNPFSEWLELFICDLGKGLSADIASWTSDSEAISIRLKQAAAATHPLISICDLVFKAPLSRMPRPDRNRTSITGLQHLGHVLEFGCDYARIYSDRGVWVGGRHPWGEHVQSSTAMPYKQTDYDGCKPISGTAYAFYIQPTFGNVDYPEQTWVTVDLQAKGIIADALRTEAPFHADDSVLPLDYRNESSCIPDKSKAEAGLELGREATVIVCPPRLVNKQEMGWWISKLSGTRMTQREWQAATLIIAELTPFQAMMFAEFFKSLTVHADAILDVYLVSEQWAVSCLSASRNESGRHSLVPNLRKAAAFLDRPYTDNGMSAAKLALILREEDSKQFWKCSDPVSVHSFFRNAPACWSDDLTLSSFLDLSQAILEPSRYRACRRALRRCLELFHDAQAVPGDDLIASLVKDAVARTYRQPDHRNAQPGHVVVGSVCVTSGTVGRVRQRADLTVKEVIHLLVHRDAKPEARRDGLKALLWIDPDVPREGGEKDPRKILQRIPGTPYVAEGGEKTVSIVRFRRASDGSIDFKEPLYGSSPEATYREFQAYSALKLGHWMFGRRHDLLAVNSGLAFEHSVLEKGELYQWILDQFRDLFAPRGGGTKPPVRVLIYPSHPVTDAIIGHIKDDKEFSQILPTGGIYPIKFLGVHTVSPILVSPMVASQIRRAARDGAWGEWSASIFDDATISGKHMRELTQFLQELGARLVYTIGLIDRTGLPVNEGVMPAFSSRHRRYWRWDVPSLGHKRDCALCRALSISHTYAERLHSPRQIERLKKWREEWGPADLATDWHKGGVRPTPLPESMTVKFGVDIKPDGTEDTNVLKLSDSSSLAAVLVELSRMTTRADVALRKADKLARPPED
jgi:hypothetical protein